MVWLSEDFHKQFLPVNMYILHGSCMAPGYPLSNAVFATPGSVSPSVIFDSTPLSVHDEGQKRVVYVYLMNKIIKIKKKQNILDSPLEQYSRMHFTLYMKTWRLMMQKFSTIFEWATLPPSVDKWLSLTVQGKHWLCEGAHANTWPPKLLCSIFPIAAFLAVWHGAAAATARLPLQPRVNTPIREHTCNAEQCSIWWTSKIRSCERTLSVGDISRTERNKHVYIGFDIWI